MGVVNLSAPRTFDVSCLDSVLSIFALGTTKGDINSKIFYGYENSILSTAQSKENNLAAAIRSESTLTSGHSPRPTLLASIHVWESCFIASQIFRFPSLSNGPVGFFVCLFGLWSTQHKVLSSGKRDPG